MNRLYRRRHRFLSKNDIDEIYNEGVSFESNKSELTPAKLLQKNFIDKEDDGQLLGIILLNDINDKIPGTHYSNLLIGTTNIRVYNKYSKDHNIILFGSNTNKSRNCEFADLVKGIDFIGRYRYIFFMEPNVSYVFDEKKLDDYHDQYDFVIPHKLYPCKKDFFDRNNIKCISVRDKHCFHILDENHDEKDIFYEIKQPFKYIHTSTSLLCKSSSFLDLSLYYFNSEPSFSLYYSVLLKHKLVRFIDPHIYSFHDHISE